jgi:nucleotide-binding universal stress UspA family protein
MYDTILIPYDGTDESEKSARHGIDLAASVGADVHGLYVIDLPGAPRTLYVRDDEEEVREEYHDYGEDVLADLREMAEEAGLGYQSAIRTGAPSEEIVDYADEEGVDATVIGSAYEGKFPGILGSTSEKVVRTATVPVITHRMQVDDVD